MLRSQVIFIGVNAMQCDLLKKIKRFSLALTYSLLFFSTHSALAEDYPWEIPNWLPLPSVPSNNPMSIEKVELGRRLFYDANLSGLGYISCSSCHIQEKGFTDLRDKAVGITGDIHPRNSMSLINIAYYTRFNWADPITHTLEQQAHIPLFHSQPIIEMAVKGNEEKVIFFLQRDPIYPTMFNEAFGDNTEIDFDKITKALASFQRTFISHQSPFDQYFYEDKNTLSSQAQKGFELFSSEKLGCSNCHALPHFTDANEKEPLFHNTGLYNIDDEGSYPTGNQGLFEHTNKKADKGRFRTPTLRNIALTAPYMHDGSVNTISEVINDYAAGGRSARLGKPSPLLSQHIKKFSLTSDEKSHLITFLESLTDESFLNNPKFTSPFK